MSADLITWTTTHGDTVTVWPVESLTAVDGNHVWGWFWNVKARNGRIVATGGEGYTRRRAAVKAAARHHPRVETLADLPAGGYPTMTSGRSIEDYLDHIRGEQP